MSASSRRRAVLLMLLAVASVGTAGCFRSTAPGGWLPTPQEIPHQAFGSWIRLQDQPGRPTAVYEGELIAVDADSIHILFDRLVSLPRASFCCMTVTAFQMDYSPLVAWGVLGTLSTLSHGFVLILSAPIWALTATSVAATASYAPRVVSTDPVMLRTYARFPQGIPPGLDRATLRPKPWARPDARRLR
jgi:hypothetical protein